MILLAQDRPSEAVAPLQEAVRSRPGAAAETYLAMAWRKTGRGDEALPLLQRAAARQPPLPLALYELGTLLHEQRRLAEAEAALQRGLQAAPEAGEFSLALGNVFLNRGETAKAESAFARVLAAAPTHPAALCGLGSVLMSRGEFDRAMEKFLRALTHDPTDARAQLLLASCLFELGQPQEGIARLRTLLRAAPQLCGRAMKACAEAGRGRLWLKPSAAAEALGVDKDGWLTDDRNTAL